MVDSVVSSGRENKKKRLGSLFTACRFFAVLAELLRRRRMYETKNNQAFGQDDQDFFRIDRMA
ncbi:MAG TPA: hypothetical protein PLD20_08880 [Blastocatellia bacterium]|nr:hypothetical protein [Blastocatellia bacterium]HMV82428.1 hypothetical protein [Blastocatellia bacterium]HMY76352.1 hypothetical protein [Blastocatellia bacterium]HMZ18030.1 hypothetical protein [Blastocatellia bacterium]HNG31153.1 hypothetical protein [Blastocatellia bacterium]